MNRNSNQHQNKVVSMIFVSSDCANLLQVFSQINIFTSDSIHTFALKDEYKLKAVHHVYLFKIDIKLLSQHLHSEGQWSFASLPMNCMENVYRFLK